jgi:hypothetical protein
MPGSRVKRQLGNRDNNTASSIDNKAGIYSGSRLLVASWTVSFEFNALACVLAAPTISAFDILVMRVRDA